MIAGVSKEQLADHGAGKGDRVDIRLGGRVSVLGAVEAAEDGVDLTDDSVRGVISVSRRVRGSEGNEACAQGFWRGEDSAWIAYPFR